MQRIRSWESDSASHSHEILRVLWNSESSLPCSQQPTTCSVLSQMNQIRVLQPQCFIIHVNINPSMVRSSKWSLSFNLSAKSCLRFTSPIQKYASGKNLCQVYFLFSVRCSVLGSETIVRFAVCFLSLFAYVSWRYFGLGMAGSFHILSSSLLRNHRNTGPYSQGYWLIHKIYHDPRHKPCCHYGTS